MARRFARRALPMATSVAAAAALAFALALSGCGAKKSTEPPPPPDTRTEFTLIAPGVPAVYLSGDFNDWAEADSAYRMTVDADSTTWRIKVELEGTHQYRFVLKNPFGDVTRAIVDPRATRIVADSLGAYSAVVGEPLPEPTAPFDGTVDPNRLVIYELFVGDFSAAGDLQGVIDGIEGGAPALADLGVNAIELMPVTAAAPGFTWGYNPSHFFAVDPDYGTPEDLGRVVEAAHAHGMAVILDLEFNHLGDGAPLQAIDETGTYGTYINYAQTTGSAWGMRDLNWTSPICRQFLLDAALFWIEQYGVDGFRMGTVVPDDYAGLKWWRDRIKERHPKFLLIAEDFYYAPNDAITKAGFDAQWGGQRTDRWGGLANNFQNIVMALLKEGPYVGRTWVTGRGSFDTVSNPMWALENVMTPVPYLPAPYMSVRYIVSHDERHVVDEVERNGSDEAKILGGIRKAKLGALALFTATGMPMFYMGEEIGDGSFIPDIPAPNKLNWSAGDATLRSVYRHLIGLRLGHPSLASGRIAFFGPSWSTDQSLYQQNKTVNYWRFVGQNAANADIVVALNFDHEDHEMTVQFPASGTWYQYDPETGANIETPVENGALTRVLSASTGEIYLKTAWTP